MRFASRSVLYFQQFHAHYCIGSKTYKMSGCGKYQNFSSNNMISHRIGIMLPAIEINSSLPSSNDHRKTSFEKFRKTNTVSFGQHPNSFRPVLNHLFYKDIDDTYPTKNIPKYSIPNEKRSLVDLKTDKVIDERKLSILTEDNNTKDIGTKKLADILRKKNINEKTKNILQLNNGNDILKINYPIFPENIIEGEKDTRKPTIDKTNKLENKLLQGRVTNHSNNCITGKDNADSSNKIENNNDEMLHIIGKPHVPKMKEQKQTIDLSNSISQTNVNEKHAICDQPKPYAPTKRPDCARANVFSCRDYGGKIWKPPGAPKMKTPIAEYSKKKDKVYPSR